MKRGPVIFTGNDDSTIREGKAHLEKHKRKEGAICPCCGKRVVVYKYKMNRSLSKALIFFRCLLREAPEFNFHNFVQLTDDYKQAGIIRSRTWNRLKYWGLIAQSFDRREDGAKSNYWRVTQNGKDFVDAKISVLKCLYVSEDRLDAVCMQKNSMEKITIQEALGVDFDYQDMVRGAEELINSRQGKTSPSARESFAYDDAYDAENDAENDAEDDAEDDVEDDAHGND